MTEVPLVDVAKTIRSKNAGIDQITFDVIFESQAVYDHVVENKLINEDQITEIFDISADRIAVFVYFDPAKAVKFTLNRSSPSGSPGETDVMGAQQYPPLFNIDLELPEDLAAKATTEQ